MIVAVALPAMMELGLAATVDFAADGVGTITVAVFVMPVPFAVAETIFVSATVELMVPVATPLAFVEPGWVSVFPLPVAASTTAAPAIA